MPLVKVKHSGTEGRRMIVANRREYEMLFKLGAQLGGNYNSTFKSAQGAIVSLQNEIQSLNKTQSDIASYQKQQASLEASQKKLEILRQQYDNIQKEIKETGDFSSALENKLLSTQLQIDKTSGSIDAQKAKLEQMGNTLRSAGVDTKNLASESARLGSQVDDLRVRQEEAADSASEYGSKATAAFASISKAVEAAGIAVALKEIVDLYTAAIEASIEFESAMTGVAKTTNLSDKELAAMGESIKDLATDIPITTEEFAGIGEVAGQLGIAKGNLLDFSTVMSMLATATTMTAEEGATLLAQFANITQMDPSFYSNLASSIVALGNNYATTEQKITEMSQGIAASASLAGMSEADMVALSAAVSSLGIEAEMGSTAMSKLISDLMTAVETGNNLETFASISNMTAEEFKKAWGQDAVKALQAFVIGLNDAERNGKSATVALTDLGITEARMQRMILSLANSGDLLNRTLATSEQAWTENTALTTEAEKRYATTQSQLIMMQNAYNNLGIAIGDNFTPELRELYSVATDVLEGVTAFVEEHPAVVKALTAVTLEVGTVLAVVKAYNAVKSISNTLKAIGAAAAAAEAAAITAEAAATEGATAATIAFNTALKVNPVVLAVTSVAALTVGIIALNEATKDATDEALYLTEASRDQFFKLKELEAEYEQVSKHYGESSDEARKLRWEIKDLEAEYENAKETLDSFNAQVEENVKASQELVQSHSDTIDSIDKQEYQTISLIEKLAELASQSKITASSQAQMKGIIDALNKSLPELNLNYDAVNAGGTEFINKLKAIAKAQAEQQRYQENYKKYVELLAKSSTLEKDAATANEQLASAQERYNKAKQEYIDLTMIPMSGIYSLFSDQKKEFDAASEAVETYQSDIDKVNAALKENKAAQEACLEEFESYSKAAGDTGNLEAAVANVTAEINKLAVAYKEAYDNALESLAGQYDLWDQAPDVVATTSAEINAALESQATYWQNYNDNLSTLIGRSGEIQGLTDLIATFADGSPDSVNAIAGMASATDEQLASMVSNWQKLQEEQKNAAGSLADLETEFTASMDSLKLDLEATIAKMDLSAEAAESGRDTIQGFIDGANGKLPAVQAAYARIAKAAVDAIDKRLEIKSPSKVFEIRGEHTMGGFIGGVTAMEPELAAAMKDAAKLLTNAFTAEEAHAAARSPHYMGHYSEMEDYGAIRRMPLSIQANATGTTDAENVFLAGEYGPELVVGARGSTVFPAGETQRIIEAISENELRYMPLYIQANATGTTDALSAYEVQSIVNSPRFATYQNVLNRNVDAVYAQPGNGRSGGGSGSPTINISYDITGANNVPELETMLKSRDGDLIEKIIDVLDDREIDRKRRAYI